MRILALIALLVTAACDESFDPIAPTRLQYSVFGYLDATADTQWIRVMPIRTQVPTSPDSLPVRVTLTRLGSNRTVELRDSLFNFRQYTHPDVGSEGLYVHNFWTTERIEPGSTYRLVVQRTGEEPAEATVEIPPDFQVEVWLRQPPVQTAIDQLRITGLQHLAFVSSDAHFLDDCGSGMARTLMALPRVAGEPQVIQVRKPSVPPRGCGTPWIGKRVLWAVGSGAEWPVGDVYSPWKLAVPEGPSNVTHSLGFLAGVLTRNIPYETCELLGPTPLPTYCELRYFGTAATLVGQVSETRCGKGPIDTSSVQLTELDPGPTGHRRHRTLIANRQGEFEIGGLEPGRRHILRVRPPTRLEPGPPPQVIQLYAAPTDTLVFAPGERKLFTVGFSQLAPCHFDPSGRRSDR